MTPAVCLCLAVAFLLGGSAAAQPTPETPGPAGAEAAVTAFTEAALQFDWAAVAALLDPAVLARLDAETQALAADDDWDNIDDLWADDDSPTLDSLRAVVAGRADRWVGHLTGDAPADAFARVLSVFSDRSGAPVPGLPDWSDAPGTAFFGHAVAPPDSLVRVVGHLSSTEDGQSELFETTARWTGRRWAIVLGPDGDDAGPVANEIRSFVESWEVVLAYATMIELFEGIDPALLK